MYKKKYCCSEMEDAVLKGSIKVIDIVHDKPEYDLYIAEFVTSKSVTKRFYFFKHEEIKTREIILSHCLYCNYDLGYRTYPKD